MRRARGAIALRGPVRRLRTPGTPPWKCRRGTRPVQGALALTQLCAIGESVIADIPATPAQSTNPRAQCKQGRRGEMSRCFSLVFRGKLIWARQHWRFLTGGLLKACASLPEKASLCHRNGATQRSSAVPIRDLVARKARRESLIRPARGGRVGFVAVQREQRCSAVF